MVGVWEMLKRAKAHAGADPDRVVWVSAVTVARLKWCHWAAVVEAREAEPAVFRAWLADRVQLALAQGVVRAAPGSPEDLLDLALSDAVAGGEVLGGDGLLGLPLLPGGVSGGGPRRWVRVGGLFLCTEPDGVEDSAVIEREPLPAFPARFAWPVMELHADLCGLAFGAGWRRVFLDGERRDAPVDLAAAASALEVFRELEAGSRDPVPPQSWKCRECEVWEDCILGPK